MSTTETPARLSEQPGTPRHRGGARPVAIVAALAVTAALLWWGYYRLSWTVPATSDGAAIALQAHDMLHGNWLLSGWTVGDVSFWTTELPEYALVETVRWLMARGLYSGTSGNVSRRAGAAILITPTGVPCDDVDAASIVELDLDELTAVVPPRGYGRD